MVIHGFLRELTEKIYYKGKIIIYLKNYNAMKSFYNSAISKDGNLYLHNLKIVKGKK